MTVIPLILEEWLTACVFVYDFPQGVQHGTLSGILRSDDVAVGIPPQFLPQIDHEVSDANLGVAADQMDSSGWRQLIFLQTSPQPDLMLQI